MHAPGSGSGGCTNPVKDEGALVFNEDHHIFQTCAGNQWMGVGLPGGPSWAAAELRATFRGDDTAAGDTFGLDRAAALRGDLALVGSELTNGDKGAAYLFDVSDPASPVQLSKMMAFDTGSSSFLYFGNAVTIRDDMVLIAARAIDCSASVYYCGAAYLFDISDPSNPVAKAKITASDAQANDAFGSSVAAPTSGNLALVGAAQYLGTQRGKTYVFDVSDLDNPVELAKITASDAADGDEFGRDLSASGNLALIGAWRDDTAAGADTGSAYLFDISDPANPIERSKIVPGDITPGARFGTTMHLSGSLAIVSAYLSNTVAGAQAGAAYLYDLSDPDNPVQLAKIEPDDPSAGDRFGFDVQIDGDRAFIGAYFADTASGTDSGALYVFDISDPGNPAQIAKLLPPPQPNPDPHFPNNILISGDKILATGVYGDSAGTDSGEAYLFQATYPGTCSEPDGTAGALVYNYDYRVYQYCDGANWVPVGKATTTYADRTPDAFDFTNETGTAFSTIVQSNIVTITGIGAGISVSITGGGSPEFRVNGGTWVTSGTIDDGDTLQLRLTSNAAGSTTNSATVTVGSTSDQWDVTTGSGSPTGCPNIGDECDDGTVYAGLSPDGNEPMYTTPADAGQFTWNNGTANWVDTAMANNSYATGEANTALLVGLADAASPYAAAVYCDGLTNVHGHSDWYLPAMNELDVMYDNHAAIGGFNTSGSFPAGSYWSSSESNNSNAPLQRFSDGLQFNGLKDNVLSVRCVRR